MALTFKTAPASRYLANNPIVFELSSDVEDLIAFDVSISGVVIYAGTFMPTGSGAEFNANIGIADVIKPYLKSSEVGEMTQLVSYITNSFIQVSVVFTQGNSTINHSATIYKGGIGKKLLRYLKEKNTDIFTYKFLSAESQFFLTTRTSGRHIVVKENELYPLYFIATDKAYTVITEYGNTFTFPAMTVGNLYAFNIEVLRRLSYATYQKLPSYLGIMIDGKSVFNIIIKEPAKSPNKYVIQFLNSFSAFERLEVTGKKISEPEFAEDNAFMVYDQGIDDYIEQNNRLSFREIIKADFGYKSLGEFLFMRDMLQSDKRYLIDSKGDKHEIRVSCENFSHDLFPTEPGSVQLTIRLVDNDSNYSPEIDESENDFYFGESIWERGWTNENGYLFSNSRLNTI